MFGLKKLISILTVIFLLLSSVTPALAEGSGAGTVQDMFENKQIQQKKQEAPSGNKTDPSQSEQVSYGNTNLFLAFVKLIFALLLVLALIYILYRFAAKRTGSLRNGGQLKNLGGVSVGTNRSVQLIKIGNEIMVLGVGDTVRLLKEITDPKTVSELTEPDPIQDRFGEHVLKALHHTMRKPEDTTDGDQGKVWRGHLTELISGLDRNRHERTEKLKSIFGRERQE
ncbi:flagellar biosynthetic protein FliO [Sporolactobacillus sp. THM19-2]|uniref:flagellar biosynthetic protein FliO n=1 Tax=Sporolactobacillus sp. THM19-2 TaxID=2511171 RepID=UPI0010216685|nr:flagellar biosynthetic protein FliO [Sporolactobacillus sp. THM19-2]RYL92960.1 flagellar biosynthetic protein FliO [Sporolactobacillus sp. THM19-2]